MVRRGAYIGHAATHERRDARDVDRGRARGGRARRRIRALVEPRRWQGRIRRAGLGRRTRRRGARVDRRAGPVHDRRPRPRLRGARQEDLPAICVCPTLGAVMPLHWARRSRAAFVSLRSFARSPSIGCARLAGTKIALARPRTGRRTHGASIPPSRFASASQAPRGRPMGRGALGLARPSASAAIAGRRARPKRPSLPAR